MPDNLDVQELHDGQLVDMRIEAMIRSIQLGEWDDPYFDKLFNELVREFINPDAPALKASMAGRYGGVAYSMVGYLHLMRLEFSVTFLGANNWPGDFDYMPEASCAISLHYPHDQANATSYVPGCSINQAILNAVMQYTRERSQTLNGQGELRLQ